MPGAFELPLAAKYLAETGRYAGVACLGAVIRGETDHYDYVCAEAARGIQDVQLATGVPCAFGVLTVETMEQALARTGGGKRDQGAHAAEAVLALAALRASLGLAPGALSRAASARAAASSASTAARWSSGKRWRRSSSTATAACGIARAAQRAGVLVERVGARADLRSSPRRARRPAGRAGARRRGRRPGCG